MRPSRAASLAVSTALVAAYAGCAVSSTGSYTLDDVKHRPSSVRCSMSGTTVVVDLDGPDGSVQLRVADGLPFGDVSVRVERPGRPPLGAGTASDAGAVSAKRAGMRFIVRAGVVPVNPEGRALNPMDGATLVSVDAQCANLYGSPATG